MTESIDSGIKRAVPALIVNADDFGAAVEVNEAVERAHREGILTSASIMIGGAAAGDAILRAKRNPRLAVGLHLVLTHGRSILPYSEIPDLILPDGAFKRKVVRTGLAIFFRKRLRPQIEREIHAQLEAFKRSGLPLDHVNGHLNFHVHPVVLDILLGLSQEFEIRAIRVPYDPFWKSIALDRSALFYKIVHASLFSAVVPGMRKRLKESGITMTEQVYGLLQSGRITWTYLLNVIRSLPEGVSEVYVHPATSNDYPGNDAPGYRHQEEFEALIDPEIRWACTENAVRLGTYSDLARKSTTSCRWRA